MSAPPSYDRLYNLTEYAAAHTSAPYDASKVDAELSAIEQSIDGLISNRALIQRDDGDLANAVVGVDALSPAVLDLIGSNMEPRGSWLTATAYVKMDVVSQSTGTYLCATSHTSGTFATDLAAGKWVLLFDSTSLYPPASSVSVTPASGISSTNAQLALEEVNTFLQSGTGAASRTRLAKMRDVVSANDFAVGGADKANEIINACAAVSAAGGMVWLGRGTRSVSTLGTIPAGVHICGESPYSSVISTTSATSNVMTLSDSCALRDLKVTTSVSRTSGFYVNVQGNGVVIDGCEMSNYYIAVSIGTVGGSLRYVDTVSSSSFTTNVALTGAGAIQALNFSNVEMHNLVITGPVLPGTQPDFGIRIQNGDTAFITDTNVTTHGKALLVDPDAASNCYALTIDSSHFDSAGTVYSGSSVSSAEFIPAGGVYDTRIANTWFGLSQGGSGCYILPAGSGVVDGISFIGCEFVDNGDCGLLASGTLVKNVSVTGGWSASNTNSGLRFANAIKDFTVVGHRAGNVAARGTNNYGITVDAGASDRYIIALNNLYGNTTSGLFDGGTGQTKITKPNLGVTPSTMGRYSTIPIGAVAYNALGTSAVHVAGTTYFSEVLLTEMKTLTGVGVLNGATVGTNNLNVAVYGSDGGSALANSALAGTLSAGANAFQEIPFTATITLQPGRYWVAVQCNGTTATTRRIAASTYLNFTTSVGGTFGVFPVLTPPTSTTADIGPIAYLY